MAALAAAWRSMQRQGDGIPFSSRPLSSEPQRLACSTRRREDILETCAEVAIETTVVGKHMGVSEASTFECLQEIPTVVVEDQ